jgi:hypothetical protein
MDYSCMMENAVKDNLDNGSYPMLGLASRKTTKGDIK